MMRSTRSPHVSQVTRVDEEGNGPCAFGCHSCHQHGVGCGCSKHVRQMFIGRWLDCRWILDRWSTDVRLMFDTSSLHVRSILVGLSFHGICQYVVQMALDTLTCRQHGDRLHWWAPCGCSIDCRLRFDRLGYMYNMLSIDVRLIFDRCSWAVR